MGTHRRLGTSVLLALCLLISFSSCSQDDTVVAEESAESARARLGKAANRAIDVLPEAGQWEELVAGLFPGTNGWSSFESLLTDWKSMKDDKQTLEWRRLLCTGADPLQLAFDPAQAKLIDRAIKQTETLRKAAEALARFDVIVPPSLAVFLQVDLASVLEVYMLLQNRVIALTTLGADAGRIQDEVRTVCELAGRFDVRSAPTGVHIVSSIRIRAVLTLLSVIRRSAASEHKALFALGQLAGGKVPSIHAKLAWLCAGNVAHARSILGKTDEELLKDIPKRGEESDSTRLAGLFDWWSTRLDAIRMLLQELEESSKVQSTLDEARQLMALHGRCTQGASKELQEALATFVRSMMLSTWGFELELAHLAIRIEEAAGDKLPTGNVLEAVLARYPGLVASSTSDGVVVELKEDHPYRMILEADREPPVRKIEPWQKR